MYKFKDWVKKRRLKEDLENNQDPSINFKFNTTDHDFADDQEQLKSELFKTVLSKYPDETMDFLHSIAQRGDEEISALLRKFDKNSTPRLSREPRHSPNDNEIVPSQADTGYDSNAGDD